jgi:glycosyltransferase involved in cell wall biosynthesis
MNSLDVKDLPPPPPGRTGWPWTEGSSITESDGNWPRISIVTPSYNQVAYLEETIRSVLLQGYPNLEYLIIDGGSNDGSVEIIQKYADFLGYWISEKDKGQSDALNRGFRRATGDFVGWQNSDDYYDRNAFWEVAKAAHQSPNCDVFYGPTDYIDEHGKFIRTFETSDGLQQMLPHINVSNQSMFLSRRIFAEGNFIDETFRHAMDYEYFIRLARKGYQFQMLSGVRGYYRLHESAKTFFQQDVCRLESNKIFQNTYLDEQLPLKLREKALSILQRDCLASFSISDREGFHQRLQALFQLDGWRALTPGLVIRYGISQLGIEPTLRQMVSQWK